MPDMSMKYKRQIKYCLQCRSEINDISEDFAKSKYCSLRCGRKYRYQHNTAYRERIKAYQRQRQRRINLMKLNVEPICSTSPHP